MKNHSDPTQKSLLLGDKFSDNNKDIIGSNNNERSQERKPLNNT